MRMTVPARVAPLAVSLFAFANHVHADDIYTLQVSVGGNTTTTGYQRVGDVLDALQTNALSRANPAYNGVEAASLTLGFRGVPLILSYPTQGGTQLVFRVPSLGIEQSFDGGTRNQSQKLFQDELKNNGAGILDRLFKEQARVSPIDPIAGNPSSLMSQMVGNDFLVATAPVVDKKEDGGTGSTGRAGIGAHIGSFTQGGLRSNTVVLPLSYTMRADLDPRRQVSINMPVSVTQTGKARAYTLAPGLGYRHPVTDDWSLSPALAFGVTGSADLGALGAMASASLASRYVVPLEPFEIIIGNMASYYASVKLPSREYSANPGIRNSVLKNGVALSMPVGWISGGGSVEVSYANTHFWGTALYTNNYHEVGVVLGTNRSASSGRAYLRAGINLLYASKSKGAALNLGYWF